MVLIPSRKLPRRTILRGAAGGVGAALCLPLLDAMLDDNGVKTADGQEKPQRFMSYFFGNGVKLAQFVPAAEGAGYPLSAELAPLSAVRDYVTVLTGFDNHCNPNIKITHHEGMVIFNGYNNRDVGQGQGFFSNAGGPTIDQVVARVKGVGDKTPIRSVQVGVSKRPSQIDFGTTLHNLSHAAYLQPLPPEHEPQKVWSMLFNSFTLPEDPAGPLRIAVLDLVKGQLGKLHGRLGQADRIRMEAHTQAVSELQKQIAALPPLCQKPDAPGVLNVDQGGVEPLKAVHEAMSQLLRYAFKCDITRVASFLWSEGASNTIYADLGLTLAHHELTHDASAATQNGPVHLGTTYAIERFAHLLAALASEPDGPGATLLDNIAIFCSTDCSEGMTHSVDDQPMLIAGRAGGKLVHPGIHYASKAGDNPTDVLLALLQLFEPAATEVGKDDPYSNTPFLPIKAG